MAKGDVVMKFDANTAAFIQAVDAARAKMIQAGTAGDEMGKKIVTAGDRAGKALGGIVSGVGGVMQSFLGVGSVVGLVATSFNSSLDKMKEKSDRLRESLQTLEDVAFRRGNVANIPAVRERLAQISGGKINREGIEGIYASISNQMGSRASESQIEKAVQASMSVITAGGSQESAANFGKTFAELRTQKGSLEGMGDSDIQEIAYAMQKIRPEGFSDRELKVISRSKKPLEAIDLVLTAARSHENSRAMESLMSASETTVTPQEIHSAKGAERQRLRANFAIPMEDRLDAWIANPQLAPENMRREIENLKRNMGTDAEDALSRRPLLQQGKAFRSLVDSDPEIRAKFGLDQAGVALDKSKQNGEVAAITEEAIWAEYKQRLIEGKEKIGFVGSMLPAGFTAAIDRGFYIAEHGSLTNQHPDKYYATDAIYDRAKTGLTDRVNAENAKRLQESLDANTAATHQNTQSNNGGPALKTDKKGQE